MQKASTKQAQSPACHRHHPPVAVGVRHAAQEIVRGHQCGVVARVAVAARDPALWRASHDSVHQFVFASLVIRTAEDHDIARAHLICGHRFYRQAIAGTECTKHADTPVETGVILVRFSPPLRHRWHPSL
jgi:hypothetical protein